MFNCVIKIASFLIVVGAAVYTMEWLSRISRQFKKFRLVGTVTSLHCYPVASCAGMVNKNATCTVRGLKMVGAYDTQFLIGRETDKSFAVMSPQGTIKQYFCSPMRQIKALCNGRDLLLSSIEGDDFTKLPLQKEEGKKVTLLQLYRAENIEAVIDLGDRMAKWLNDTLQVDKLRLYEVVSEVMCVTPGRSTFGNYVFAIQDSIDYINRIISVEPKLSATYFRPNIVLTGCSPLEETKWSYIQIGNVCFKVSGPDCRIISDRNSSTSINWKHAWELAPEVPNNVRVIDGCNISVDVGVNATIIEEGEISIGDPVFACY
ncbi:unnamed protein product [Candidula unifasciata]|uniref:MOSC domain-containing protein n=1 Tax=Candidula unifasciata TaxID=100452 RepID=A0A8S3ZLL3_9EUPU|nr:unnamed protein product [Candidula unifasciata]